MAAWSTTTAHLIGAWPLPAWARHATRAAAIALVAVVLGACGSVGASTAIHDATRDLAEAKQQKADEFAVYYYTRADIYLQKAKKLAGMGQYQASQDYARVSAEASAKSLDVARINKDQAARRDKFAPKKDGKEGGAPAFTPGGP